MRFVLASHNQKKLRELGDILGALGIEVVPLPEGAPEPEENGQTFEENSYKKAFAIMQASGETTIADDSGLMVDYLGGAPGVYSARFAGDHCDDERNNQKLLGMLEGLAELGIRPAAAPEGTFYVWGSLAALPDPINDADRLFERLLEKKMMIVPGHFFDIRPYRTRPVEEPMRAWARFSYGPSAAQLEEGLRRLGEVVREAKAG